MFRETRAFHPDAQFVHGAESIVFADGKSCRAEFEPDDVDALMLVYTEIARRLSRRAYTSHGAA